MFKDQPPQAQLSGWAEPPPVAEETTVPMPFVDAFDDVGPRTLDSVPPVEHTEIMPREVARVLAQDAKSWGDRAVKVQTTACFASAVDTLIWMSMNVYSFLESRNPGAESSHISGAFHNVSSIGMIVCGAVMVGGATAGEVYRRKAWRIKQRLESAIIPDETEEA